MSAIIGHERQIEYLNKVFQRGRVAHAYLFYGPEGVGKFTLAKMLAKYLYCEEKPKSINEVCNSCSSCRLINGNSHTHVFILDPDHTLVSKKEKRKDIPIEDIRELKRIFSLAPEGDKWRVAIINQAERMSSEAADALLKLLEEPGRQTLMILASAGCDLLPQTIVSRAQPIRFSLVPEKVMEEFLKDKMRDAQAKKEILTLAAGRPGIMMELWDDESRLEKERKILGNVSSLLERGNIPEAFKLSENVAPVEGERSKVVEYILRLLRAKLVASAPSAIANSLVGRIKNISRIIEIMETTNVNTRLALDAMFLEALQNVGK